MGSSDAAVPWPAGARLGAALAAAAGLPLVWYLLAGRPRSTAEPTRNPADFGAFLKARGEGGGSGGCRRDPSDFGSFLKRGDPSRTAAAVEDEEEMEEEEEVPAPGDAVVAVLYGTEYGFSKEVAQRAAERLRALDAPARLWCALPLPC